MLTGKRVLFVVAEFPTRGTAGYHSYNRAILSALLELNAEVHVLALTNRYKKLADDLTDLASTHFQIHASGTVRVGSRLFVYHPASVARILKNVLQKANPSARTAKRVVIGTVGTPRHEQLVRSMSKRIDPDVLLLDTMFQGGFAHHADVPAVIVGHDVFHQRTVSLQKAGLDPVPAVSQAFERNQLLSSRGVIAISRADEIALRNLVQDLPISVFPPPVQASRQPAPPTGNRLFYMGSAAHHNVQALSWFLSEVWPLLRSRLPAAELVIAGDICNTLRVEDRSGIRLLGRVDDPVDAASGCGAAIDPVQAGSGVKVKILSYISMGLPCITTTAGSQGLEDYADQLMVADDAIGFADAIEHALLNPSQRRRWTEGPVAVRTAHVRALGRFVLDALQLP